MMKGLSHIVCFAAALVVISGCALYRNNVVVYDLPSKNAPAPGVNRDEGDYLIALAVSGGGSRAAVWHAAIMKELYRQVKLPDGRSITDEIDYISSVSGGSLSSAYWCLEKPDTHTTDTASYDAFFQKYLSDMRLNIEAEMAGSPFTWYRYLLASEDKAIVLKNTFDKLYFHHKTFAELADRQRRGVSPVLIANGTDMDTGAKFLFCSLDSSDFEARPEEFTRRLESSSLKDADISFGGDVLSIVTPKDIGISIEEMEVSRAAAASASVPLILGPVVLKDNVRSTPEKPVYVHVNDGGVNDNQGLVTLMELLFGKVEHEEKKFKGAMIIIVDANQYIDPRYTENMVRAFSTVGMVERSFYICFYQGRAFAYLTIMNVIRSDPRYRNVTFVYLSPYLAGDPGISDTFTRTPTRFKITPEQADNLEMAAKVVVEKVKEKMMDKLGR
jgi:predicted acylesterase/phospholipase RssA